MNLNPALANQLNGVRVGHDLNAKSTKPQHELADKNSANDLVETASHVRDQVVKAATDISAKIGSSLEEGMESVRGFGSSAYNKLAGVAKKIETTSKDSPVLSMAAAAGAGFLLGGILMRRSSERKNSCK